ncbi:MAG TPA: deoxyribodipyrimidine photo-lyase [Tepidisphaeraceae bacterium]|nr:deoxyribodipyrimidine photo-lyase [Tepidisphaeraceae bacterium]
MIQSSRIKILNGAKVRPDGRYVLYWMQASQRTRFNHALEFAIAQANELQLPLLVCFGLMDDYPEANARHYAFMLQGLRDVDEDLTHRGIKLVVKHGPPPKVALHYAKYAALLLCDRGYTRHQKAWRVEVAEGAACRVIQVETDCVVPVEIVSNKAEFAARTIRPKIHRNLKEYLAPLHQLKLKRSSLHLRIKGNIDVANPDGALSKLKLDRSVSPSSHFLGGAHEAQRRLRQFISNGINGYAYGRSEPAAGRVSHLSPYLHFGQISPLEIALAVQNARNVSAQDREAFLEELIVRRELAINFVNFNPKYDRFDALPVWVKQTLKFHSTDRRPYVYSLAKLEDANIHDPYWNAAQKEMTITGYMHNSMRMYWGKKILEWTRSPKKAFETALHLNNKYFLDGRDPNSYANVGWLFGLHDRPWTRRPIFGTVRYMNAGGLERKFDIDAYINWVKSLA